MYIMTDRFVSSLTANSVMIFFSVERIKLEFGISICSYAYKYTFSSTGLVYFSTLIRFCHAGQFCFLCIES